MILLKKQQILILRLTALYFLVTTYVLPFPLYAQDDNNSFGDSIFISNGLIGKIFLLSANTNVLPDFDTLKPVDNIYTKTLDIPPRDWSSGFPGLRDRIEWFGIEYTGSFRPNKAGKYLFRLMSDDGSKLIIDEKLIINNDGIHPPSSKTEEIFLDDLRHSIKVLYFQGPRYQIALQLFASLENSKEEIFPGDNFKLYTPGRRSHILYWLSGILIILIFFFFWRKKRMKRIGLMAD